MWGTEYDPEPVELDNSSASTLWPLWNQMAIEIEEISFFIFRLIIGHCQLLFYPIVMLGLLFFLIIIIVKGLLTAPIWLTTCPMEHWCISFIDHGRIGLCCLLFNGNSVIAFCNIHWLLVIGAIVVICGFGAWKEGMCTVEDSVYDHDTNHDYQEDNHVARELIRLELCGNIALIALHIWVEYESVRN